MVCFICAGKCMLQLYGPADPTGCGEGMSFVPVPLRQMGEQQSSRKQVTGSSADLRKINLDYAKNLLYRLGVSKVEVWEPIHICNNSSLYE